MLIESSPGSDWGHAQKFLDPGVSVRLGSGGGAGSGAINSPRSAAVSTGTRDPVHGLVSGGGIGAIGAVGTRVAIRPTTLPPAGCLVESVRSEIATKKVKQRPKPSVVSPHGTKWGQRV